MSRLFFKKKLCSIKASMQHTQTHMPRYTQSVNYKLMLQLLNTHHPSQGELSVSQTVQAWQRRGFLWKRPQSGKDQVGCFFLGLGLPPFWQRRAGGRKEGRVENPLHVKHSNGRTFAIECSQMWRCVCPSRLTVAAEAVPRLKTTATRIFRLSMAAQRGSSSTAAKIYIHIYVYIWHLTARTRQAHMFA